MIWKIDLIVSVVELWALPVAIKRASLGNFYQKEKKKIVVDRKFNSTRNSNSQVHS